MTMEPAEPFPTGLLQQELFFGVVCSVAARSVSVNLSGAGRPSGSHFRGGRYGRGEVGEFALIEAQRSLLLGRVTEVHLPDRDRRSVRPNHGAAPDLDAVARVELLGCVAMDSLDVVAGIDTYPRLGDRVYAAPHGFLALLPRYAQSHKGAKQRVLLSLGAVGDAQESTVLIEPERLLGRHCAILGATGGGKSWTAARIVEECLKHRSKVVLIDATGEYRTISGLEASHCHLGQPLEPAEHSVPCSFPPTSFLESDFIALFQPAGKVQGPKLRAAIKSLRLASLRPSLAQDGCIVKINQSKQPILDALKEAGIACQVDDPRQPFDIRCLGAQIEQECVYPDGFNAKRERDTARWGGEDGNFSYCLSLLARIDSVLTSTSFNCVFASDAEPLTDKIDTFIASDARLLCISLAGIAFEYNAREIIANAIGRHLLAKARARDFVHRPIVVIVDEAHNFLGRQIGTEDHVARLDAFELIAKEGRKYGLSICLASQRPRDITEAVLSQIGTLIVHRLTNDRDREVVERACGEIDRSASAFLPNLRPGEAAIIGVDFPIPLTIQIWAPQMKPKSEGPDFQTHWATE